MWGAGGARAHASQNRQSSYQLLLNAKATELNGSGNWKRWKKNKLNSVKEIAYTLKEDIFGLNFWNFFWSILFSRTF